MKTWLYSTRPPTFTGGETVGLRCRRIRQSPWWHRGVGSIYVSRCSRPRGGRVHRFTAAVDPYPHTVRPSRRTARPADSIYPTLEACMTTIVPTSSSSRPPFQPACQSDRSRAVARQPRAVRKADVRDGATGAADVPRARPRGPACRHRIPVVVQSRDSAP